MVLERQNRPETRNTQQMLPLDHPDRIQVTFDDRRLVANAGLLLPVTLAQHLGLRELVDNHVDLGDAPGRANAGDKMLTLVASAPAFARAGSGDLPAQFPVGPRPPTGSGQPRAAVPGLGCRCRTRRRAADHRPGLHHLRNLWSGQGGRAPPRLHRPAGLSPAAGRGSWHRGGADVSAA